MVAQHGGETEGLVALSVVLRAYTEEPEIKEPHRTGEDQLAIQVIRAKLRRSSESEVADHATAQARKGLAEGEHGVELQPIAMSTPALVVEVLLAPGRVNACGLQVPESIHTDPDLFPGRRDSELGDALEDLRIVDPHASGIVVPKATAATPTCDPRRGTARSPKPPHRTTPISVRKRSRPPPDLAALRKAWEALQTS